MWAYPRRDVTQRQADLAILKHCNTRVVEVGGGGFLIVPALVLLGGLGIRQAIATSLVVIMLAAFTGFIRHWLSLSAHGVHLDWRIIGISILAGAAGSLAGHQFAVRLPQTLLRPIFGVSLIAMAAYIILRTLPRVW